MQPFRELRTAAFPLFLPTTNPYIPGGAPRAPFVQTL